jgi:hypothetical protein
VRAECAACDGHPGRDHTGPDGACSWHGADGEGWWPCDCVGFTAADGVA